MVLHFHLIYVWSLSVAHPGGGVGGVSNDGRLNIAPPFPAMDPQQPPLPPSAVVVA